MFKSCLKLIVLMLVLRESRSEKYERGVGLDLLVPYSAMQRKNLMGMNGQFSRIMNKVPGSLEFLEKSEKFKIIEDFSNNSDNSDPDPNPGQAFPVKDDKEPNDPDPGLVFPDKPFILTHDQDFRKLRFVNIYDEKDTKGSVPGEAGNFDIGSTNRRSLPKFKEVGSVILPKILEKGYGPETNGKDPEKIVKNPGTWRLKQLYTNSSNPGQGSEFVQFKWSNTKFGSRNGSGEILEGLGYTRVWGNRAGGFNFPGRFSVGFMNRSDVLETHGEDFGTGGKVGKGSPGMSFSRTYEGGNAEVEEVPGYGKVLKKKRKFFIEGVGMEDVDDFTVDTIEEEVVEYEVMGTGRRLVKKKKFSKSGGEVEDAEDPTVEEGTGDMLASGGRSKKKKWFLSEGEVEDAEDIDGEEGTEEDIVLASGKRPKKKKKLSMYGGEVEDAEDLDGEEGTEEDVVLASGKRSKKKKKLSMDGGEVEDAEGSTVEEGTEDELLASGRRSKKKKTSASGREVGAAEESTAGEGTEEEMLASGGRSKTKKKLFLSEGELEDAEDKDGEEGSEEDVVLASGKRSKKKNKLSVYGGEVEDGEGSTVEEGTKEEVLASGRRAKKMKKKRISASGGEVEDAEDSTVEETAVEDVLSSGRRAKKRKKVSVSGGEVEGTEESAVAEGTEEEVVLSPGRRLTKKKKVLVSGGEVEDAEDSTAAGGTEDAVLGSGKRAKKKKVLVSGEEVEDAEDSTMMEATEEDSVLASGNGPKKKKVLVFGEVEDAEDSTVEEAPEKSVLGFGKRSKKKKKKVAVSGKEMEDAEDSALEEGTEEGAVLAVGGRQKKKLSLSGEEVVDVMGPKIEANEDDEEAVPGSGKISKKKKILVFGGEDEYFDDSVIEAVEEEAIPGSGKRSKKKKKILVSGREDEDFEYSVIDESAKEEEVSGFVKRSRKKNLSRPGTDMKDATALQDTVPVPAVKFSATKLPVPGISISTIKKFVPVVGSSATDFHIPGLGSSSSTFRVPGLNSTAVKQLVPGFSTSAVEILFPGLNLTTIKQLVPGISSSSGAFHVPGLNLTTIKQLLPGFNSTATKQLVPGFSSSSTAFQVPGLNLTTINQLVPGFSTSGVKIPVPGLNLTTTKQLVPEFSNSAAEIPVPGMNLTTVKQLVPGIAIPGIHQPTGKEQQLQFVTGTNSKTLEQLWNNTSEGTGTSEQVSNAKPNLTTGTSKIKEPGEDYLLSTSKDILIEANRTLSNYEVQNLLEGVAMMVNISAEYFTNLRIQGNKIFFRVDSGQVNAASVATIIGQHLEELGDILKSHLRVAGTESQDGEEKGKTLALPSILAACLLVLLFGVCSVVYQAAGRWCRASPEEENAEEKENEEFIEQNLHLVEQGKLNGKSSVEYPSTEAGESGKTLMNEDRKEIRVNSSAMEEAASVEFVDEVSNIGAKVSATDDSAKMSSSAHFLAQSNQIRRQNLQKSAIGLVSQAVDQSVCRMKVGAEMAGKFQEFAQSLNEVSCGKLATLSVGKLEDSDCYLLEIRGLKVDVIQAKYQLEKFLQNSGIFIKKQTRTARQEFIKPINEDIKTGNMEKSDEILEEGTEEVITAANEDFLEEFKNPVFSQTLVLEQTVCSKLLLRLNGNFQKVVEDFGVEISFSAARETTSDSLRAVNMSGPEENVERCLDFLRQVATENWEVSEKAEDQVKCFITFDPAVRSRLVQQLHLDQTRDKYKLSMITLSDNLNCQTSEITLMGPADNVDECADYIDGLLRKINQEVVSYGSGPEKEQFRSSQEQLQVKLDFPWCLRWKIVEDVIGIQNSFQVSIALPASHSVCSVDHCTLTIDGEMGKVLKAKQAAEELIRQMASTLLKRKLDVDLQIKHDLINGLQQQLQQLMEKYQVEVALPRSESELITITGLKDNVEECSRYIETVSNELFQKVNGPIN